MRKLERVRIGEVYSPTILNHFAATSRNGALVSTSVSSSPSSPRKSSGKKSSGKKSQRTVKIILVLACSLLVFGVVMIQGRVSGREFAPSHFRSRTFSFYEIPWLQWQISPIRRRGSTGTTANSIRLTSLIRAPKGPPKTWHLVDISRGMTGNTPGDASLLTRQLAMRQDGKDFWKDWNKKFSGHAKVLWPVVQRLAERELYVLIPELLVFARSSAPQSKIQQFQNKIDDYLITEYQSLIQDMREAKRPDLADAFTAELQTDFPNRVFPKLQPATPVNSNTADTESSDPGTSNAENESS